MRSLRTCNVKRKRKLSNRTPWIEMEGDISIQMTPCWTMGQKGDYWETIINGRWVRHTPKAVP